MDICRDFCSQDLFTHVASSSSLGRTAVTFPTSWMNTEMTKKKKEKVEETISPVPSQGYCSYTLFVGTATVIQFRPSAHRLDMGIVAQARSIFGDFAPATELVGVWDLDKNLVQLPSHEEKVHIRDNKPPPLSSLYVYRMSRVRGVPLSSLLSGTTSTTSLSLALSYSSRASLVRSFARFLARGWRNSCNQLSVSDSRGKIGVSLRWRLEAMRAHLPLRFRPIAAGVLAHLDDIEALPWVLTHGDVVPGNVMVERVSKSSGVDKENEGDGNGNGDGDDQEGYYYRFSGMIDWAEAEMLPFGVGLYGVEELLGVSVPVMMSATGGQQPDANNNDKYPPSNSRFEYYPDAETLRNIFWAELEGAIPWLNTRDAHEDGDKDEGKLSIQETVQWARKMGILLWHGIAFDDGRLDRVVEEGRDDEEVQRLDVFLRLGEDE